MYLNHHEKMHADELRSLLERLVKEEQMSLGTGYTYSLSLTLRVNPCHRDYLPGKNPEPTIRGRRRHSCPTEAFRDRVLLP